MKLRRQLTVWYIPFRTWQPPGTSVSLLAVYLVVRVQAEDWCSAARTLLSPLSSLCL